MAKTYTEFLLKDENTPNGHSDSLYRVLILTAKPTWRLYKKMKVLLKLRQLSLHGDSLEK